MYPANINQKKAAVALLISDKEVLSLKLMVKKMTREQGGHFIMIKESIHQEDNPKYVCTKQQNCKINEAKTDRTEEINTSKASRQKKIDTVNQLYATDIVCNTQHTYSHVHRNI